MPFDIAALAESAVGLLARLPQAEARDVPLVIPYTLHAMQQATLSVYAELVDEPRPA